MDEVRVTVRLEKSTVAQLNRKVDAGEYPNLSEAVRAGIRKLDGVGDREPRPTESY